eukprot:13981736-Ditylum_brightwellii.AAC.1
MNVDADMLVVEFQAQNVAFTTTVIRLPVNVVQLCIKEVTINSKYFSTLTDTATEGPLLKYIAWKQLWLDAKMASVNWGAFQIARKHHAHQSQQI